MEAELKRLMQRSMADPVQEPDLLRALLTATLYAHVPRYDDSGKLHLIMFTPPSGSAVIPIFSDVAKADAASGSSARVIAVRGRQLFEATPGAAFLLDPNDESMTLYPEEIAALLDDGVAVAAPVSAEGPALEFQAPEAEDAWLLDAVASGIATVPEVTRVHLVAARPHGDAGEADRLLVIAAVPAAHAERASRAIALALYKSGRPPRLPVDFATYEPGEALAAAMDEGLRVAWSRALRASQGLSGG